MNRISENITKWKLDTSKLSKADKEVLEIVHFPTEIGYRQAAQRRVKKMKAGSQFVELQRINISDVSYNVTSKEIAKRQVARTIYKNQREKEDKRKTTRERDRGGDLSPFRSSHLNWSRPPRAPPLLMVSLCLSLSANNHYPNLDRFSHKTSTLCFCFASIPFPLPLHTSPPLSPSSPSVILASA